MHDHPISPGCHGPGVTSPGRRVALGSLGRDSDPGSVASYWLFRRVWQPAAATRSLSHSLAHCPVPSHESRESVQADYPTRSHPRPSR